MGHLLFVILCLSLLANRMVAAFEPITIEGVFVDSQTGRKYGSGAYRTEPAALEIFTGGRNEVVARFQTITRTRVCEQLAKLPSGATG